MFLVGPLKRGEQIVAGPVQETFVTCGDELGAAFHAADARFAGAVIAEHPHGREQRDDLPRAKPVGQQRAGERRAVVALRDQRRAVLEDERLQHTQRLGRRGIKDRRPRQLHPAGQIPNRQDLAVATIDRTRWLGVIDGPHRTRTSPVKCLDDESILGLESPPITSDEIRQDGRRHLGAASPQGRPAEPGPGLFEQRLDAGPFSMGHFATRPPAQPRQELAASLSAPPVGQRSRREAEVARRAAAG